MYICMHTYMFVCIHIYKYIFIHTCICIFIYIYIYTHMYVHIYEYIYVYIYIYICICICVCVRVYINEYLRTTHGNTLQPITTRINKLQHKSIRGTLLISKWLMSIKTDVRGPYPRCLSVPFQPMNFQYSPWAIVCVFRVSPWNSTTSLRVEMLPFSL